MVDSKNICISSSYDNTLSLFDVNDIKKYSVKFDNIHKNAVLDFDWQNRLLISGDKGGCSYFTDINESNIIM